MKNYLKILFVTMLIQLGGFMLNSIFVNSTTGTSVLSEAGVWIFLACFPIAIIVDIVLALRWGKDWKQKLIYIFLMPTNYVGPVLVVGAFLYIGWAWKQIFGM